MRQGKPAEQQEGRQREPFFVVMDPIRVFGVFGGFHGMNHEGTKAISVLLNRNRFEKQEM